MSRTSGLQRCEEAFERLLAGNPIVSQHVGLEPHKITASVVSVEAGFDKGYLKRSRQSHLPLLSRIEANKTKTINLGSSYKTQALKAIKSRDKAKIEMEEMKDKLDKVLSQNLILVEHILELESKLRKQKT